MMNKLNYAWAFVILATILSFSYCTSIARLNLNDILKFREKNHKLIIDALDDLNPESNDVIGIHEKIQELKTKANDMLSRVHKIKSDACSTKVKYHVKTIIGSATESSDFCVSSHVEQAPVLELNLNQKNCLYDVLHNAEREIEKLNPLVESCEDSNESD